MFLFVGETVEAGDVLEEVLADEGGGDVILPEDGFFEIEFVLFVEVADVQLILMRACGVLGRVVTLLATCHK